MLKIYHNPACRKSRAGVQYLQESGVPFTVVEYLKTPVTEQELEKLLVKLNLKPSEMLRTQEEYYKLNLRGKKFEDHELVRIIVEQPKLLRRPVVEGRYKAVVGDPVGNIDPLLK
jgi:arsenate reductase